MSEQFGMVALETVNNAYLGGDASLACSAETASRIDNEVIEMVKDAYEKPLLRHDQLHGRIQSFSHPLRRDVYKRQFLNRFKSPARR